MFTDTENLHFKFQCIRIPLHLQNISRFSDQHSEYIYSGPSILSHGTMKMWNYIAGGLKIKVQ